MCSSNRVRHRVDRGQHCHFRCFVRLGQPSEERPLDGTKSIRAWRKAIRVGTRRTNAFQADATLETSSKLARSLLGSPSFQANVWTSTIQVTPIRDAKKNVALDRIQMTRLGRRTVKPLTIRFVSEDLYVSGWRVHDITLTVFRRYAEKPIQAREMRETESSSFLST